MSAIPTRSSQRIIAIDTLRGFALLGILVMNIQSFSMPSAYNNPTVYGDLTGLNRIVWAVSHLFTDHKMMNIFSMLFGAGIILFTDRLEQRGEKAVRVHYRRTFWLLLIGLAHAYIWSGDILVMYAICGFIVVWFRKMRPSRQLTVGIISLCVASLLMIITGLSIPFMSDAQIAEFARSWSPPADDVTRELAAFRSGWSEQTQFRVAHSLGIQTTFLLFGIIWRVGGLMLIGMALYKWGLFSAKASDIVYKRLLFVGLCVGLPIVGIGMALSLQNNFSFDSSRFGYIYQFNYWGSVLVSLGYIAAVMLLSKRGRLSNLSESLAAVGQMALTNYLLHTIIATLLFYGHGLGWFGSVERVGQAGIVLAIWLFQLLVSPLWLKQFRFGPAEWVWRSLTYWKLQSLRRVSL